MDPKFGYFTLINNIDLFINEPPIDEIIGRVLIKKNYDI